MSLQSIQDHYDSKNIRHPILIETESEYLQPKEEKTGGDKQTFDEDHKKHDDENDEGEYGKVKEGDEKVSGEMLNGSRRRFDYLNKYNETLLQGININDVLRVQPRIKRQRVESKFRNTNIRTKNMSIQSLDKKKAQFTEIEREIEKEFHRTFDSKKNGKNSTHVNVEDYGNFTKSQELSLRKHMIFKNEEFDTNINERSKSFEIKRSPEKSIFINFPNASKSFLHEVSYQNEILRKQTEEYRSLVSKLELDLCRMGEELSSLKQIQLIKNLKYEDEISRLMKEIGLEKEKKEGAFKELKNIEKKSLEEEESLKRTISKNQGKQREELTKNNEKLSRHTQFCVNLSMLLSQNKQNSLIATEYDKLELDELTLSVQSLLEKSKKYEDFINSISEMYCKIEVNQHEQKYLREGKMRDGLISIKQLWKWLKKIGSFYSFGHEICAIFAEKLSIKGEEGLNVKHVLERAVLRIR